MTSSMGFLQLRLEEAVEALAAWRRSLTGGKVSVEEAGRFPQCLHRLEPLVAGARPQELLVQASDGWTAYFDCLLRGTDAVSAVGHLSRTVRCQGVAVAVIPNTVGVPGIKEGRFGAVQFELFGPLPTEFLNYVRTISAAHDGNRWVFSANGVEQWFEEADAYEARRVRERFTLEMLERYCKALGIDVFDPERYGPAPVCARPQPGADATRRPCHVAGTGTAMAGNRARNGRHFARLTGKRRDHPAPAGITVSGWS